MRVVLEEGPGSPELVSLKPDPEDEGYHIAFCAQASAGTLYRYEPDDDPVHYPDPAPRYQPDGPHGPSQVINPCAFPWTDQQWRGAALNGESAPYLGKEYPIEIAETASGEIEFGGSFVVPASHRGKRREVLRDWYIARAKEKFLDRVEQHTRELGVRFNTARTVDNRYRWGSCTVSNNVNFNWRLIKAPMFVIVYVIVHELAHLIESNHTSRFRNVVHAKSSTMEKAKTWLKERGQFLEQEL